MCLALAMCPRHRESVIETEQMSFVETRQMSQQRSSVLSQQQTSVLSPQQILCVSETLLGAGHIEIAISRQPQGNFSNRCHPQVQNRGAVLMGMVPWRVAEKLNFQNFEMGQIFR